MSCDEQEMVRWDATPPETIMSVSKAANMQGFLILAGRSCVALDSMLYTPF
jgi:hypothetical protein